MDTSHCADASAAHLSGVPGQMAHPEPHIPPAPPCNTAGFLTRIMKLELVQRKRVVWGNSVNVRSNKNSPCFLSSYAASGTAMRHLSRIHLFNPLSSLPPAIKACFTDGDAEVSRC